MKKEEIRQFCLLIKTIFRILKKTVVLVFKILGLIFRLLNNLRFKCVTLFKIRSHKNPTLNLGDGLVIELKRGSVKEVLTVIYRGTAFSSLSIPFEGVITLNKVEPVIHYNGAFKSPTVVVKAFQELMYNSKLDSARLLNRLCFVYKRFPLGGARQCLVTRLYQFIIG